MWILYLTSEEESPFYRIFTAGGTGGLSSNRRRAHSEAGYESRQNYNAFTPASAGYAPTPVDMTPQKAPREEPAATPMTPEQNKPRAKAMYAYSADPSDSNEGGYKNRDELTVVSFAKGETLVVLDNSGKWWQVQTPAGQIGVSYNSGAELTIDCAVELPRNDMMHL